jgi:hypothetical protein
MNPVPKKAITIVLMPLMIMGVFGLPNTVNAGWNDLLGTFGIGNSTSSNYGYNSQSYDYSSTNAYSDGDIKITKEVKEIGVDDNYHDKIEIRSGALVEVWIEVKNTSSHYSADTIVRDEIGGNTVYVKDSLRVNNQISRPGLTSGGLRLNIPSKGKMTIIYRMRVCGNSGYPMRAYASAPGVGAGTDAIIITTENFNVGGFDNTSICLSQYQTNSSTVYTGRNYNYTNYNYGNPFGDWTGVNNSNSLPFTSPTPATTVYQNPFGDWTGVNNSDAFVAGTSTTTTAPVNYSNNPFGDWTGVQSSNLGFDAQGYQANNSSSNTIAYTPTTTVDNSYAAPKQRSSTYFIAPTTGVNKTAPFVFAGILTLGFVLYRKRELIFA